MVLKRSVAEKRWASEVTQGKTGGKQCGNVSERETMAKATDSSTKQITTAKKLRVPGATIEGKAMTMPC